MRFLLLLFYTALLRSAEIHERVLICGVCRNVESRLESTRIIMESIGNLFDDYRILIYENNSTDRTADILHSWANANSKVWLKTEILTKKELDNLIVNVYSDGGLFV